jgi:uncharacterized membrane protein YphA (DoxX/SURF4 family)
VNIALWISQVLLALGFLFAGWMHAIRFQEAKKQMAWVRDVPEPLARLIGAAEILGAIGLILPALTRILPWLTPLAASRLLTVVFDGLRARERSRAPSGRRGSPKRVKRES